MTLYLDGVCLAEKSSSEGVSLLFEKLSVWEAQYDYISIDDIVVILETPDTRSRYKRLTVNGYKANRSSDSSIDIAWVNEFNKLISVLRLCRYKICITNPIYEADDLLYTLSRSNECCILSGDKDIALCDSPRSHVFLWNKITLSFLPAREYVKLKFGIKLSQLQDYLAVVGDHADGWKGWPMCGDVGFKRGDYMERFGITEEWLDEARNVVTPTLIPVCDMDYNVFINRE